MSKETIIFGAQMGRFFSHYALRALLVLYLVKGLEASDGQALSMSGFLMGFLELSSVIGGFLADRYLGVRRSTRIGTWGLLLGYATLAIPSLFYMSAALIVVGSSLFVSNISVLLSLTLPQGSHAGFTRMYMWQNVSALIGAVLCSSIAELYGFAVGFACAAAGVLVSALFLQLFYHRLPEREPLTASIVKPVLILVGLLAVCALGCSCATWALSLLPLITVMVLGLVLGYLIRTRLLSGRLLSLLLLRLVGLTLFFVIEDQTCSSLMLLTERHVDRMVGGWMIPSAFIVGLNPIVIALFAPLMARRPLGPFFPFALTAAGFCVLALLCQQWVVLPLASVMGVVLVLSIAELMIGPSTLAFASTIAPVQGRGVVMGVTGIAFSLAYQGSGLLGRFCLSPNNMTTSGYAPGFMMISVALIVLGGCLHKLVRKGASAGAQYNAYHGDHASGG